VILETVGVGQSELDIAGAADTTVVVLVPESGDSIQAMKAGLMEIANFIVLNKSDRPGADQSVASIGMVLRLKQVTDGWNPEIIQSVASEGTGINEIAAEIQKHRGFLESTGLLKKRRQRRLVERIRELVNERLESGFWDPEREAILEKKIGEVLLSRTSPYEIADELFLAFRQQEETQKSVRGV
jgi:LAO/AO transport system kinase